MYLQCPQSLPKFYQIGTLGAEFSGHSEYPNPEHLPDTALVYFKFYWLGTLWSHHWVYCKVHPKWATLEHRRYFLWENSRYTYKLPNQDISVTWPGTFWMYWLFPVNEPLRGIACTFFGKIQDVPINYLMGTLQSHDWVHSKCTGCALGWDTAGKLAWKIPNILALYQAGIW